MSEQERYSGRIRRIKNDYGLSLEELCYREIKKQRPDYVLDDNGAVSYMRDELYEKYHIINGELYEVELLKEEDPYDAWSRVHKNGDGVYSFDVSYHNGGTCLNEMLEDAIKNMDDSFLVMRWEKITEDNHPGEESVLWGRSPVCEPHYFGSVNDEGFPENYYTHFMRFPNQKEL